ncbi:MAG TPA: hypothetical protein VKE40_14760, partial [Gemmataceae bacterium]|nr:hypothetical protein [Gemmataceae bacterium]
MGIPWWAWVVIGVAALISLLVLAARSFRARIRREFIAYLAEHHPELEVTGARGRVLFIRASGEEGQWHLHKIIEDIVHLSNKEDTPERRA